ncbi:ComEA family DNA-binding protein [Marinoscillum sp.]|uniref:ComEA family DNA-binding protein n=1 Tax=Marinoscillum sp. TaxID=2024838 RepID=UPI003BABE03F
MRRFCFIALLLITVLAWGQDIDLEEFAEKRFQIQDEDISYEDLYESLLLFYTNPLNLNKASKADLASLYILTPAQVNSFFQYREDVGKLISLYELQAIPDFDVPTIRDLLPFVTVTEVLDSRPLVKRILNEENNYLLLRYSTTVQQPEGYQREDDSEYTGDRNTLYGRFRVSHSDDFSLGMTFEKDAGEQLAIDPSEQQYGFDFYSYHFALQNKGKFKTLVLGDYQMQFGQGLVFGAGFGAGKGAETINTIKRNSTGVKPYTSVLESGFFRGAAATLKFGSLEVTSFGSYLAQDGNLQNDTTYSDFEEFVNAIQQTGYHRTANELGSKNTINELSTGMAVEYNIKHQFSIGATGLYSHYSRPLQKKPNNYNQYEFSGDENFIGSVYSNFNYQNLMIFGEVARSQSGGMGAVSGILLSLTPKLDFSWSFRHYDKDFHSYYGNAFGEGTRVINERGTYWGIAYRPSRKYQFSAYFDKFTFPWLRFRVDAPSSGFEYLGRFTYKPTRSITIYAQFRQENKELSVGSEDGSLSQLTETVKRNYIVNLDYAIGRAFSFKSRIQGSSYSQVDQTTHGLAILQDVNVSFWKMKLSTRFALFDTDDYNNRQYIYEKDVLYAFSIPAYNGIGTRTYFLAQYNVNRSLTLWARYSMFDYTNQDSVGSGLNEIQGSLRSDVKLMLRYKFRG